MTSYRTLASSLLLASSLGFVAAPAFAMPHDCGPKGAHGEYWQHHSESMQQHHNKLHATLKLTPEQEVAWKKMMDSKQPMEKMDPMKADDWAKLTAPERADKMLERMQERQARQVAHVAALKEFYAVLTPEQKKTFDSFHGVPRAGKPGKHGKPGHPRAAGAEKTPEKKPTQL